MRWIATPLLVLGYLCCCYFCAACAGEEDPPPRAMFDAPAGDVEAAPPPLVIPDGAPTVAFVSDSIGAGLHLAEHQAFPAVLQRLLYEDGQPFHLINASESGRTSAGGASAMAWILRSTPDVVVLAIGGNDGLRGIPVEETKANLRKMVATAHDGGAKVLLLGVRLPENYGEYAVEFDALYPSLAKELELAFVPFYMEGVGGVPEMNLEDGLHPTAQGQRKLATNVAAGLKAILSKG